MQILAAADLHGERSVYEWLVATAVERRPDAVVLAGDLLGSPEGFDSVIPDQEAERHALAGFVSRFEAPVMYIMGNDDYVDLAIESTSVQSIHRRRVDRGRYNFVGYQCTLPFMGGINEKSEDEMQTELAEIEPLLDAQTVLVTHGPVHGILDRGILDRRAGSRALLNLTVTRPFRVHIHGHVHRDFGRCGRHFNVASGRRKRAMLIDVTTLHHEVLQE